MKRLQSCSGFVPGGHLRTLYFRLPTEKNNHVSDWLFYRETQNPRCWADERPGDKWVLFSPFTWENREIRLENQMVGAIPFGKFQTGLSDLRRVNFPLLLVCSG